MLLGIESDLEFVKETDGMDEKIINKILLFVQMEKDIYCMVNFQKKYPV